MAGESAENPGKSGKGSKTVQTVGAGAKAKPHDVAATVDTLGFAPFVTAVYNHLADKYSEPPLTFSVEGDWGSGKSSFMLQLRERIKESRSGDYVVWFNAWRHDKDEAVWAAFAVEFVRQLNGEVWRKCDWRSWPGLRRLCRWVRNRKSVAGIAKQGFAKWLGRRLVVRLLGWLLYCVCPLTPMSVLLWVLWKLEITAKLGWSRFDWDRGWQDVAKTVALVLVWIGLGWYAVCAWDADAWAALTGTVSGEQVGQGQESLSKLTDVLGPGMAGVVCALGAVFTFAWKFTGNPLRYNLRKYAAGPNYHDKVAFIEKFHADFARVVSAIAGDKRVYVFIDDLDRCDVPKAADLLQALNLMIPDCSGGKALPLVYVLGLDREKVAAGLAVKFKDLLPYLGGAQRNEDDVEQVARENGLRFGYSFIEKFIQLPFLVPRPKNKDLSGFLDSMFPDAEVAGVGAAAAGGGGSEKSTEATTGDVDDSARVVGGQTPGDSGGENAGPAGERELGGDGADGGERAEAFAVEEPVGLFESQEEWEPFFEKPRERLSRLTEMVAAAFGYNPRNLKRFMQLFLLRARIWHQVSVRDKAKRVPRICMEQLGKIVAISLRWPLLLSELQRDNHLLAAIVDFGREARGRATGLGRAESDAVGEIAERPIVGSQYCAETQAAAKRWCERAELVDLVLYSRGSEADRYDLKGLDVGELLSTLPPLAASVSLVAQDVADADSGKVEPSSSVPDEIWKAIEMMEVAKREYDPEGEDYWIAIPGGSFLMGAQREDASKDNYDEQSFLSESPVHRVTVHEFRVGRYPVTVGEYLHFMEGGGYEDKSYWEAGGVGEWTEPEGWDEQKGYSNRPVVGVSWYEAAAYASWAGCRLLTEAEWEYAARGEEGRRYPWGSDEPDSRRVNYNREIGNPTPVGVYATGKTPEGLCDMAGNVWEWCADVWRDNHEGAPVEGSVGAGDASESDSGLVVRGGAWYWGGEDVRCARRRGYMASARGNDIGFRVASGGLIYSDTFSDAME